MFTRADKKMFGIALDASNDPMSIQLKLASMNAREIGIKGLDIDPYDSIARELRGSDKNLQLIGKFPVPSWLSPRPLLSDAGMVTKENMDRYVADGGMDDISTRVNKFVLENVFPNIPIMIGIDHSATGGVISALSGKLGPENLCVLVLDQHFDGLPLGLRLEPGLAQRCGYPVENGALPGLLDDEAYCCGNFWKHLMDNGIVCPENLAFIGVADYPEEEISTEWHHFKENYLFFESLGCNFFPLKEFEGQYSGRLEEFIEKATIAPNLYVSLDLDVGAYRCVHAARYMDRIGMDRKAIMEVADIIKNICASGRTSIAGMDIMEFNVHFLGIDIEPGKKDETLSVAIDFLNRMLI